MKQGYLSHYFDGVAAKRLSAVEADVLTSHQHEFQGVEGLKAILGEPDGKVPYQARVLYLTDADESPVFEDARFTWYDARAGERARGGNKKGQLRWEYRLYFPTTRASGLASTGDLLVIARLRDGSLLVVIAEQQSGMARQIEWLFGLTELPLAGFTLMELPALEQGRIEFASRLILEAIGIVVEWTADDYLQIMLERFHGVFPTTREFSAFARSTLKGLDPCADPDGVLLAWMEREEMLFRTLERHLMATRRAQGFAGNQHDGVDVQGFLAFSLTVQNRRKSRVGLAFENHLERLFSDNGLQCTRTGVTENKSKPDFLFPGVAHYHDRTFDARCLTMLGVKSTCKDRWRQVLAEADRIADKHLLTLETAISPQQTDEMAAKRLQLVVPRGLHGTYTAGQQRGLLDVARFIGLVRARQGEQHGQRLLC